MEQRVHDGRGGGHDGGTAARLLHDLTPQLPAGRTVALRHAGPRAN